MKETNLTVSNEVISNNQQIFKELVQQLESRKSELEATRDELHAARAAMQTELAQKEDMLRIANEQIAQLQARNGY